MMSGLLSLVQPGLLLLDPEAAHEASLCALERGLYPRAGKDDARLRQTVFGLDFPNPLGMAAGFDKDARVPGALLRMGFGFTEIGTVTPKPQGGNPRPRVFRLIAERAVINRLGFNSGGHEEALARLRNRPAGIIGVNIGANKSSSSEAIGQANNISSDPVEDYVLGLRAFVDVADYFTVNISSPNTPGLRDLQTPDRLNELLARLMTERAALDAGGHAHRPILVKLAPDIDGGDLPAVIDCLTAHGVDGIILTNTTIARDAIPNAARRGETGGLSGRPLFKAATRMLARVYLHTGGKVPLIGVGGIDSGEAALGKIRAGASLVQLYTGMIYRGPGLIGEIKRTLVRQMESEGAATLDALRGRDAEIWARM